MKGRRTKSSDLSIANKFSVDEARPESGREVTLEQDVRRVRLRRFADTTRELRAKLNVSEARAQDYEVRLTKLSKMFTLLQEQHMRVVADNRILHAQLTELKVETKASADKKPSALRRHSALAGKPKPQASKTSSVASEKEHLTVRSKPGRQTL